MVEFSSKRCQFESKKHDLFPYFIFYAFIRKRPPQQKGQTTMLIVLAGNRIKSNK